MKDQFPHLIFNLPVGFYGSNDSTNRLFVLEQGGVIRVFSNDSSATSAKVFLDIHDSTISGGELGLLGLAFHPQFATNGFFYVDYTRNNPLRTVISRFQVSASNPDSTDRSSQFVILQQSQPFSNHNGGQIAFGPDGYLYIGFGDGGSEGDPLGNGQKKTTLLSKILRINVDSTAGARNYTIPPDNPFYGDTTVKQEIYANGLRNPWRFSFDGQTLWCGDVGQDAWEEVDTIVNGGNYGWSIMEGLHCYKPPSGCSSIGLTLPIWEYHHDSGRCAITGGFVYRGSALPSLAGRYIYADECTGEIWALTPVPSSLPENSFLLGAGTAISSFGEDRQGEIYVCDYGGGKIYKLWGTVPGPFTLSAPADHAVNQPNLVTCSWTPSAGASSYRFQLALDSLFSSLVVDDSELSNPVRQVGPLPDSTLFFWRVRASNGIGSTAFTLPRRFTTATSSIHYDLVKLWNLLSLPLDVADGRKTVLFPAAVSPAFGYAPGNGYQVRDTLRPRAGYWLRFNDSATAGIAGTLRVADTVDVVAGWNLIGSIATPLPTNQITSLPGGLESSPFFGYQGSYIQSDTVWPGKGYWIKADSAGRLVLHSPPEAMGSNVADADAIRIHILPAGELPPPPPGVDEKHPTQSIPKEYALEQNYPNPFNPTTVIRYALPAGSLVRLSIYNSLGQTVRTLVDGVQEGGERQIQWDASSAASGIYYYRLTATALENPSRSFTQNRKMLLVR